MDPVGQAFRKERPADLKFFSIALGCKVIAAASSDGKRQFCKDHGGADEVVDYTKEGWQVRLYSLLRHVVSCPTHLAAYNKKKLLIFWMVERSQEADRRQRGGRRI